MWPFKKLIPLFKVTYKQYDRLHPNTFKTNTGSTFEIHKRCFGSTTTSVADQQRLRKIWEGWTISDLICTHIVKCNHFDTEVDSEDWIVENLNGLWVKGRYPHFEYKFEFEEDAIMFVIFSGGNYIDATEASAQE